MNWAQKPYGVLVADDSPDDRFFLRKAIARTSAFHLLAEVENGHQAIAYLQQQAPWNDPAAYPVPDLLLLDLKMPQIDGLGVLQWLRAQPTRPFSVIVLSGSFLEADKECSVKLGADAFFTKSSNISAIQFVLQEIERILDRQSGLPVGRVETANELELPLNLRA